MLKHLIKSYLICMKKLVFKHISKKTLYPNMLVLILKITTRYRYYIKYQNLKNESKCFEIIIINKIKKSVYERVSTFLESLEFGGLLK